MEGILVKNAAACGLLPEQGRIRVILAEKPRGRTFRVKRIPAEGTMLDFNVIPGCTHPGFFTRLPPRPGIAKPNLREQVEQRLVGTPIAGGDLHQEVVRGILCVFHNDIEITVIVKDAGIDQFELFRVPSPAAILIHQPPVRKLPLRVFVEHFQVGMRRGCIQKIIQFLHILAVVPLGVGQPKETLLEDWVVAIPQHQREAQALQVIAEPGNAILPPAKRPASGLVVGNIIPGVPVGAVILANRSPLALAQIRPPAAPILHAKSLRFQTLFFRSHP